MEKLYKRVKWANFPSTETPLNEENLNKMDKGIDDLDNRLVDTASDMEDIQYDIDNVKNDVDALEESMQNRLMNQYNYPTKTLSESLNEIFNVENGSAEGTLNCMLSCIPYGSSSGSKTYIVQAFKQRNGSTSGFVKELLDNMAYQFTLTKDGADTLAPFKKKITRKLVASWSRSWNNSQSDWGNYVQYFDCKSVPDYQKLTADNFAVEFTYIAGASNDTQKGSAGGSISKSYNASTGILGVSGLLQRGSGTTGWIGVNSSAGNIYAYYVE